MLLLERWYNIRSKGFLNDNKGQKILPLIVFRRTSIEKDDTYLQIKSIQNHQSYIILLRKDTLRIKDMIDFQFNKD